MSGMSDILRDRAWRSGFQAAIEGKLAETCDRKPGTISYDDWHDGYGAGLRQDAENDSPAVPIEEAARPATVLQRWVEDLSFMQQTVLLAAVRGPDGVPKYGPTKMLLRWYRRCVLLSAMDRAVLSTPFQSGGGSFTGPSFDWTVARDNEGHALDWRDMMHVIVGDYLRELDAIPHHFQLHFMHAIEIVGYKHPDELIREWWHSTYLRLVHDMHLWPETEEQLDKRLGDDRDQWLARNDPATVD